MNWISILLVVSIGVIGCKNSPPIQDSWQPHFDGVEKEPTGWKKMGMDRYIAGDYPRAINFFEVAKAESKEEDPQVEFLLFYSYLVTGNLTRAHNLTETAVALRPHSALGYYQAGLVSLWEGNAKDAALHLQRALELESHPPRTYFYLGVAQGTLGLLDQRAVSFKRAEKEYLQVLQKNSKDFTANYELATLYLYWKIKLDEAEDLLTRAEASLPSQWTPELPWEIGLIKSYYLPLQWAILQVERGKTEKALASLLKLVALVPAGAKPLQAELYFQLGRCYLANDNGERANKYFELSQVTDPTGPYAQESAKLSRSLAGKKTEN